MDHSPKSHLSVSSKNLNSFGKKKKITVKVVKLKDIIKSYDLIKIDTEGSEAKMIQSLKTKNDFASDIITEISNKSNSTAIFNHLRKLKLNFYNLSNFKKKKINNVKDMPMSHLDGFLIIKKYI